MRKFIMIASSKGGIGKSTNAIGIAKALAGFQKKVLLCDLDYGNACLDMLCGCEDNVIYTSADCAQEICSAFEAVIRPWDSEEIYLLPAPGGGNFSITSGEADDKNIFSEDLCNTIKAAADAVSADFVILDTGAGVNGGATAAAKICDTALIVASHSPISLRSAQSTAARLISDGVGECLLIVNSFDAKGVLSKRGLGRNGIFDIIDTSRVPLLGIVPYDYDLSLYQEKKDSMIPPLSGTAFSNIAKRILGDSVPLFTGMKRHRKIRNKFYK